ncbi:MAG TPA: hypothetical protein ENI90_02120, partial [Methylothermaceae bacterium]|nr:hypothetical protein [Methylothermaceae bacterium]
MTVQRSLMLAFVGISVMVALVVTVLAFWYVRRILLGHIEVQLGQQAARIMEQIDMTLFERSANVATWSRLRIMEDLRTRDLDKRLSALLRDLQQGYSGVYQVLLATDTGGEILAASDPAWIGHRLTFHRPLKRFRIGRQTIHVMPLALFGDGLAFQSAVKDEAGRQLGWLYAVLNLEELRRLLEQTNKDSAVIQMAVLLDRERRVMAVSDALRGLVPSGKAWDEIWKGTDGGGIRIYRLQSLTGSELVAGFAAGNGYRAFPGLGWQ